MKRILKVVAGVFGALLLSVSALAAYIVLVLDPNDYKQELASAVKQKTDMDMALTGKLAWQLYPNIGIKLGETTLTDPKLKETLVAVKEAAVSVQLMPLLAGKVNVNAVLLDGAVVRFVQYADGKTSWDNLLEKLKSPEEEPSKKVAFEIETLDVKNTQLTLVDEKAGVTRTVSKVAVQAQDIDPDKAFPIKAQFQFAQKDAVGKVLQADNQIETTVALNLDAKQHVLTALNVSSQLSGNALPAPVDIVAKAEEIKMDLPAQLHQVKALTLAVDYRDAKLKQPATLKFAGNINADLAKQIIQLSGISLDAQYQDAGRPAPITAKMTTQGQVNLTSGQASLPKLIINATLTDKSLPKAMPVSVNTALEANWKTGDVRLSSLVAQLAGVRVDSQVAVKLPALASGASPVSKGMTINGSLQTNTFNPRQLMATLGMAAPVTKSANVLQRVSISSAISGNETQVLASNLRIALDGSNITGEAGVRELPKARLYARLNLDQINADNYLPPSAAPSAAKADAETTKKAVAGLLPVALLRSQNIDVALSAGALDIMTYPIRQFRVAATARGGVVNVSELRGSIYNGSFSVPATIDVRGAQPVVNLSPNIQNIDLGPIAKSALKKDVFTGRMNFNGSVKVVGNDADAWIRSAQGPNTLRLDNGLIKGVNVTDALFNALGQYQALLPALTGRDVATLKGKVRDTEIVSMLGETSLSQGVVSNKSMKADLKDIQVGGNGTYNLVTQDVDYRFQLKLDKKFWGVKYAKMADYPIPVRCNGNLKGSLATLCGLDQQGMQGIVAQMAQARLNEEVDKGKAKLETKLNEKLGEKLNPQQQEAVKQIFDLFKR